MSLQRSKFHFSNKGFSLAEVVVALGCTTIVLLTTASMLQYSMNSQMNSLGKFDGVEQRSSIRDLIFSSINQAGTTCVQRLGLQGKTLQQGTTLQLDPNIFPHTGLNVKINKIYLANANAIGASGNNPIYSTQLRIEQQLTRGLASNLAGVTLGTVTVTTDGTGLITACNWDNNNTDRMQVCNSTQGTAPTGSTCYLQVQIPVTQTCPTGTTQAQIDASIQHCVPANVSCYNQNLSNQFDGSVIGCQPLPAAYAIHYQANYTPPNPPPPPTTTTPPTTTVPPTSAGAQTPTGPTPSPCDCGGSPMTPGGSQLCIDGYNDQTGGFLGLFGGSTYDMWDVQVCNSAGVLQAGNPSGYINTDGYGVSFGWRIGTCYANGGLKSYNGKLYTEGSCN